METVYKAFDGKEFKDVEKCKAYEASLKKGIKYFKILHTPDLCETGQYQRITYVAVYDTPKYIDAEAIVSAYALYKFKHLLVRGVQGYGVQLNFSISKIDETQYDAAEAMKWCNGSSDRIVLTSQDFGEMTGDENVVNYMDFIK